MDSNTRSSSGYDCLEIPSKFNRVLNTLEKIEENQRLMIKLLNSINITLRENNTTAHTDFEQVDGSTSDRSYYINWDEVPQIMGVKDLAKMINGGETATREIMHSRGFPLLKYHKGFSKLRVDKDEFRKWLLGINENLSKAIQSIREQHIR